MKERFRFCLSYFAFWMVFFAVLRAVFLAYQHGLTARLGLGTIFGTFLYGARMDMAASAFPSVVVFTLATLSVFIPGIVTRLIAPFTVVMLALISFLATVDLELFRAWGFRLDGTPLLYLNTPREMLASAGASPLLLLSLLFLVLAGGAAAFFLLYLAPQATTFRPERLPLSLATFTLLSGLTGLLVFPARGGFQLAPMTQAMVYFSQDNFADQAAINVAWNFFDSLWWKSYEKGNPYQYLPEAEAGRVADSLMVSADRPAVELLATPRPNVILIIWESFTAEAVAATGGMVGVTPEVEALVPEGVLFDRFYAAGDRSAKGLSAILSGFPAQPHTTIIQTPRKSASLPFLTADLARQGYHTAFYYGGELEFANIKSYLINAGFEAIVGKGSFDRKDWNSKWGAHDHVVFNRLLTDLHTSPAPFFDVVFTLSSHEPFQVPAATVIPGRDEQSRFLNSLHYTDKSLGDFIRRAKAEPWWRNTLIVVMADHGHRLPLRNPDEPDQKWVTYHIPMLWLGGALARRDTVIHQIGSQTDFPRTLLAQLGLEGRQYRWGRNLLASDAKPFAYFVFDDGFGLVTPDGAFTWDNVRRRRMFQQGRVGESEVKAGEALLQASVEDYVRR